MTNEETAATSIPLHSLLKLLHATKVLGRLEVEVSSGITPLYAERALHLAADLPEDLVRTIHDDARHAVAIARPLSLSPSAKPNTDP